MVVVVVGSVYFPFKNKQTKQNLKMLVTNFTQDYFKPNPHLKPNLLSDVSNDHYRYDFSF